MNNMQHLYISRSGDREMVSEHIEMLKLLSDEEISKRFESAKKVGIVGSHGQVLYLVALRIVMIERFGESGIIIVDNIILKFQEEN